MTNSILIATLAGLAGMLGWGFADFFAKKTIDKVGDLVTLAWAHVFGVILLVLLVVGSAITGSHDVRLPSTGSDVLILAFFGALQAIVYYLAYKAFAQGKLSLLNPIFSSYSGLVVILSVVLFGEIIGGWQLVALAGVFLAIMSLSVDHESLALGRLRLGKAKGFKEIALATVLAALWTVLWGRFVMHKDWLSYAAIMYGFMFVTIWLLCKRDKVSLRVRDHTIWKFFVCIGAAEVLAYTGVSLGYSQTSHLSIVAVLSAAFSIPTVILAHIFLGERINTPQKIGIALAVLGVCIIPLL